MVGRLHKDCTFQQLTEVTRRNRDARPEHNKCLKMRQRRNFSGAHTNVRAGAGHDALRSLAIASDVVEPGGHWSRHLTAPNDT